MYKSQVNCLPPVMSILSNDPPLIKRKSRLRNVDFRFTTVGVQKSSNTAPHPKWLVKIQPLL